MVIAIKAKRKNEQRILYKSSKNSSFKKTKLNINLYLRK